MSRKGKVYYYITPAGANPVKEFLESLSNQQQSKIFRIFQYIEEYGLQSMLPHVKKVKNTPLWEIRILGKDNIRILYIVPEKDAILALHGFKKKKQKIPQRDLNLALQRYEKWQQHRS